MAEDASQLLTHGSDESMIHNLSRISEKSSYGLYGTKFSPKPKFAEFMCNHGEVSRFFPRDPDWSSFSVLYFEGVSVCATHHQTRDSDGALGLQKELFADPPMCVFNFESDDAIGLNTWLA